jgi:BlaI family transcriptional regulator, penicillinase repressor
MARRTSKTLTEVELEFMQILWRVRESTPDGIQDQLLTQERDLTGGSIRKILSILMRKGYVVRRKQGKSFYYRPVVERERAQGSMIGDMLTRMFGGSAVHLVAALLDSHEVPGEDLDTIEKLIEKRRSEEKK